MFHFAGRVPNKSQTNEAAISPNQNLHDGFKLASVGKRQIANNNLG